MQSPSTLNLRDGATGLEAKTGNSTPAHIVGADRLTHGIVVQFDDGICAMYPVELLRALIPQLDASAIQAETH